ncbi:signal peptidase I [Candidatus Obscuribacterales bacterium]|nr:signal peptidase I [Candidatus Obscuribacterales bacterium]MBX3152195.1 signal peptidase I [Candidatus Obscuribacterales bacterium]
MDDKIKSADGEIGEGESSAHRGADDSTAEIIGADGEDQIVSGDGQDDEQRGIKRLGPKKEDEEPKKESSMLGEVVQTLVMAFAIFLVVKAFIAEARYIPSSSMEPTLNINDRILVEKLTSRFFGRQVERGDIIVFFPPTIETGVPDNPLLQSVGGLPFLSEGPPVFVKRVVGIPGDTIEVKSGQGVFINGKKLDEPYVKELPQYDLKLMSDIGGMASTQQLIQPYADSNAPIVVPDGQLFMMGDNRNHSADSHVWGFLDKSRIVGRSCAVFWQDKWLHFGQ